MKRACPKHPHMVMTLLLERYVCDICDPPGGVGQIAVPALEQHGLVDAPPRRPGVMVGFIHIRDLNRRQDHGLGVAWAQADRTHWINRGYADEHIVEVYMTGNPAAKTLTVAHGEGFQVVDNDDDERFWFNANNRTARIILSTFARSRVAPAKKKWIYDNRSLDVLFNDVNRAPGGVVYPRETPVEAIEAAKVSKHHVGGRLIQVYHNGGACGGAIAKLTEGAAMGVYPNSCAIWPV